MVVSLRILRTYEMDVVGGYILDIVFGSQPQKLPVDYLLILIYIFVYTRITRGVQLQLQIEVVSVYALEVLHMLFGLFLCRLSLWPEVCDRPDMPSNI